jgi:hypothetical protein
VESGGEASSENLPEMLRFPAMPFDTVPGNSDSRCGRLGIEEDQKRFMRPGAKRSVRDPARFTNVISLRLVFFFRRHAP